MASIYSLSVTQNWREIQISLEFEIEFVEPNNQGKLHLLVGSELKREKGSKNSTMEAWGLLFS